MTLSGLVERYAQLERRGVGFYRGLAERFAGDAAAARIWREMSNTEASHFALLGLAQDWIAMAGAEADHPSVTTESLDAVVARMEAIEAAAAKDTTALADAVGLSIAWEELELPRILDLLPYLPMKAHGHVLAGMLGEAAEHFRQLAELARTAGLAGGVDRVDALAGQARAALG